MWLSGILKVWRSEGFSPRYLYVEELTAGLYKPPPAFTGFFTVLKITPYMSSLSSHLEITHTHTHTEAHITSDAASGIKWVVSLLCPSDTQPLWPSEALADNLGLTSLTVQPPSSRTCWLVTGIFFWPIVDLQNSFPSCICVFWRSLWNQLFRSILYIYSDQYFHNNIC